MNPRQVHTFANMLDDVDFIEIPIIQRDYAQGRAQAAAVRDSFLSALHKSLLPGGAALNLDFVYGGVQREGARTLSVLDGQQRLTTLFLLHWYLAALDGETEDFRRRWVTPNDARSRFSYATRPSATEFFQALARCTIAVPEPGCVSSLSHALRDAKWFFDAWRQDPTVNACLGMLDAIHRMFATERGMYRTLVQENRVTFHYLDLRDFGLSDDLYIKMNARGKALTPFENFKAWLVERVSSQPWAQDFAWKLDQQWADFFWTLSGRADGSGASASVKEQPDHDELFLRFFYADAYFEACLSFDKGYWAGPQLTRSWLTLLRDARGHLALRDFDKHHALRGPELGGVMKLLDFLSGPQGAACLPTLQRALSPKADYDDLLRLHAVGAFVRSPAVSTLNEEQFEQCLGRWLRVTSNLIRNTRTDDHATATAAIKGLTALAADASRLYESLVEKVPAAIGFSREQTAEECRKAALILQDPAWEPLLRAAESHSYLQGRVGFLLNFSTGQAAEPDKVRFKTYTVAIQRVVTQQILGSSKFLLQRALLSLYDYLRGAGGNNHTFCIPNATAVRDRQENWLPVFEDVRFAGLLDLIEEDAARSLEQLIAASSANDWRAHVIGDPTLITYCALRLIRREGADVLLLSKTRKTGYYAELRSLALHNELARLRAAGALLDIKRISYAYVYDDAWPSIQVHTDADYTISYSEGRWHCLREGKEPTALPESIAVIAQKFSS
ncbi:DUF262 domain-containing protein [Variovorax boronicumulans]|uniref:DUF262 domain-containing protein n=1 Tax=Variovorax boronicumulans TaxID=436515 RepID=UPI003395D660